MKVHGDDALRGDASLLAEFARAAEAKKYAMNYFDYSSKNDFRCGPLYSRYIDAKP